MAVALPLLASSLASAVGPKIVSSLTPQMVQLGSNIANKGLSSVIRPLANRLVSKGMKKLLSVKGREQLLERAGNVAHALRLPRFQSAIGKLSKVNRGLKALFG